MRDKIFGAFMISVFLTQFNLFAFAIVYEIDISMEILSVYIGLCFIFNFGIVMIYRNLITIANSFNSISESFEDLEESIKD